jgi:hypothetical protein
MFRSVINRGRVLGLTIILATVAAELELVQSCPAGDATKAAPKPLSLNSLSMEVEALQALNHFGFDEAQLQKVQQCAAETVQQQKPRKAGKASKEFREKLQKLHRALKEATDDDLIAQLSESLAELQEKENPTLDDRVEPTEAARQRATDVRRLLRPSQLASYLGQIAGSVVDPVEGLLQALTEVRSLGEKEWQEEQSGIAEDIGRSVAGLDVVKAKRITDQVAALLARSRGLSKTDFAGQESDLEKAARGIIGNVTPAEVLQHRVDLDLATLLANPRLAQACRARLRSSAESKTQATNKK